MNDFCWCIYVGGSSRNLEKYEKYKYKIIVGLYYIYSKLDSPIIMLTPDVYKLNFIRLEDYREMKIKKILNEI